MTVHSGGRAALVVKLNKQGTVWTAWKPGPYAKTPQQVRFGNAARECGIQKGMSGGPKALREKMISCLGPKLRKK